MRLARARAGLVLTVALAGCGLSVVGTAPLDEVDAPPPSRSDAAADGPRALDGAPARGDADDEGLGVVDTGADTTPWRPDAGGDAALPPPDPSRVTVSYAAGKDKKVYAFDVATNTFSVFATTGCPMAEETAVLTDGSIFITSFDNQDLYRVTAAGCALVKTTSGAYPYALGTAPAGTVSATTETLVGYINADYVRVDAVTGNVTRIATGALGALRPSGDVTAIGARGYLAAAGGTGSGAFACPAGGDCIVEVNLTTGAPVALVEHLAGLAVLGIAHSRGGLLLYANGQVFPYDPLAQSLGSALASMPTGANFTGAGAPPYPGS